MALAYRTFQKYVADGYTKEGVDNFVNFISDQHLYRMFMVDEYHLWVAKDEAERIIGMASLRSGTHISLLFVDENHMKMGIGRALMKTAHELAGGEKDIAVYLIANGNAVPFYQSLGMKFSDDVMQYNHIEWTEFTVE